MQDFEYGAGGGRLLCRKAGGGITVIQYQGRETVVRIPPQISGCKVVEIAKKAFLSQKQLREVYIPETVQWIGDWVFAYCSSLERIYLAGRELHFGKGVFKQCARFERVVMTDVENDDGARKEQSGALLAAAVNMLEAEYLFSPLEAGEPSWLAKWDARMMALLEREDIDGYLKTMLCSKEDCDNEEENRTVFLKEKRKSKVRMAMLRLLNDYGLEEKVRARLKEYLKDHVKGCESEETWEVVCREHGADKAYFDLLIALGGVTAENFDALLQDMEEGQTEMKAYLLKYREETLGCGSFFASLSFD